MEEGEWWMDEGGRMSAHKPMHAVVVLAGVPFVSVWLILAGLRLQIGGRCSEGGLTEKRVARQNGWSHEQRSVYKPKAEQQERGARGGRGRKGKLQAPLWTEKGGIGGGSLP
ncbi:hypothetical protein AMECASPLE_012287 [Ameca splendens]|uniref:Uncharacterized protein n=1 Tax=Ameca splendens TaxID=208324 RepID=A0ABV0Z9W7_9TELE